MNVSALRSKLGALVDKAGGIDQLHIVPQLGGLRRELQDLEDQGHLGGADAGAGGGSKRRKRKAEEEDCDNGDVDAFGAGDDNDEGESVRGAHGVRSEALRSDSAA